MPLPLPTLNDILDTRDLVLKAMDLVTNALQERDPAKVLVRVRRRLARREAALSTAPEGSLRHMHAAIDVAGLRITVAAWEERARGAAAVSA